MKLPIIQKISINKKKQIFHRVITWNVRYHSSFYLKIYFSLLQQASILSNIYSLVIIILELKKEVLEVERF